MSRRTHRTGYRIAVLGFLAICALTLMPSAGGVSQAASTAPYCIICGDFGGVDFTLNILLFVPLGLGLGVAGLPFRRILLAAAVTTLCIELLQMTVIMGRDASLGDLVANTLGGGLGALLAMHLRRIVRPDRRTARRQTAFLAVVLVGIWWGTAWAYHPWLPDDARWFGARAPDLANYKRFPGTVLSAHAGGEILRDGPTDDQERLTRAVHADPAIGFEAVLGRRPYSLAPVALIVDQRRRDIIFIGQDRQDLGFSIRLRANSLRLWSPQVNLRDGMAADSGDTVRASGALRDGVFELESEHGGTVTRRRLPVSPSWGWSLVTPWASILGEGVGFLTATWLAGLFAILAYWSVRAGGTFLALPPVMVGLLLAACPWVNGLQPVPGSEWTAAAFGLGVGGLAALVARKPQATADETGGPRKA